MHVRTVRPSPRLLFNSFNIGINIFGIVRPLCGQIFESFDLWGGQSYESGGVRTRYPSCRPLRGHVFESFNLCGHDFNHSATTWRSFEWPGLRIDKVSNRSPKVRGVRLPGGQTFESVGRRKSAWTNFRVVRPLCGQMSGIVVDLHVGVVLPPRVRAV